MPDHMSRTACESLRRVLGGTYTVAVADDVTAVFTTLPARCAAAATRVDGHLWVAVDLDKPLALRQARAMINDYRSSVESVDLCDDDLNRDWQMQSALLPLPRPAVDPPVSMSTPWAALAACGLTGASGLIGTLLMAVNGLSVGLVA